MSKLALGLQQMLKSAINHECEVWFENCRHGGWMFKSTELHQQRLGYNYKQAKDFIEKFDWSWVRNELSSL